MQLCCTATRASQDPPELYLRAVLTNQISSPSTTFHVPVNDRYGLSSGIASHDIMVRTT